MVARHWFDRWNTPKNGWFSRLVKLQQGWRLDFIESWNTRAKLHYIRWLSSKERLEGWIPWNALIHSTTFLGKFTSRFFVGKNDCDSGKGPNYQEGLGSVRGPTYGGLSCGSYGSEAAPPPSAASKPRAEKRQERKAKVGWQPERQRQHQQPERKREFFSNKNDSNVSNNDNSNIRTWTNQNKRGPNVFFVWCKSEWHGPMVLGRSEGT